jgi:hypothetical protein
MYRHFSKFSVRNLDNIVLSLIDNLLVQYNPTESNSKVPWTTKSIGADEEKVLFPSHKGIG